MVRQPLVTNRVLSTDAAGGFVPSTGCDQAQQLVGYVGGEESRYLCWIVGGVDLHHVAPNYVNVSESPHQHLSLAAREAPDLRRPCTWRERRVYEIHIKGYVSLRVPHPLADAHYSLRYTFLPDLVRAYELEAQLSGDVPVIGVVQRASHPDLDRVLRPQEPLLDGAPEGRPVGVLLPEVGVPGIRMTVELHEGQRSVHRCRCPQLGEGDRVVATEDYRDYPRTVYGLESFSYSPVTLLYVAGDNGHVAVVYD